MTPLHWRLVTCQCTDTGVINNTLIRAWRSYWDMCNWAFINIISYTCAFLAVVRKSIFLFLPQYNVMFIHPINTLLHTLYHVYYAIVCTFIQTIINHQNSLFVGYFFYLKHIDDLYLMPLYILLCVTVTGTYQTALVSTEIQLMVISSTSEPDLEQKRSIWKEESLFKVLQYV